MIKKLLIFITLATPVLHAGIQDGREIPDKIRVANTSNRTIVVGDTPVASGKKFTFAVDHDAADSSFIIRMGNKKYSVAYPTYTGHAPIVEVLTTAELDVTTMQCVAGDFTAINNSQELDEVCLVNDTLYKVAAVVMLNKTRSLPRMLNPHETISRMVRDQQSGKILLTDENHAVHSISFPCRSTHTADHNSWSSVTLSVNTIKWFGKGFSITSVR